jgi:hypothetical protein
VVRKEAKATTIAHLAKPKKPDNRKTVNPLNNNPVNNPLKKEHKPVKTEQLVANKLVLKVLKPEKTPAPPVPKPEQTPVPLVPQPVTQPRTPVWLLLVVVVVVNPLHHPCRHHHRLLTLKQNLNHHPAHHHPPPPANNPQAHRPLKNLHHQNQNPAANPKKPHWK